MAEGSKPALEVLLEFRRVGLSVKVTAMDPETLTEGSIVGPASAGEAELTRAAIAKLRYMLKSRKEA
jgi:hypothetical protein